MNKTLFKLHSWMALVAVVPLLVICITGSILVFKHEIDSLLIADKVLVESTGRERQTLDTLESSMHSNFPNYEVVGWVLFQDQDRADVIYTMEHGTSEWSYALVDQYTGEPLRAPMGLTHHLTDWLLSLHYTFLLGDWGLLVTCIFSILLCLLGITGFILYRKFWKNFFTLRWNARMIVYFSDLHKMTGIIAAPVLLVLGFTGTWWNVTHFAHELEEHADGFEHHKMVERLYSDDLSLQGLLEDANSKIENFETTYISFPWEPDTNFTFWGDVHSGNPLLSQYASTVSYNTQSGEHLGSYDIREASLGAKIVDSYRRLHFGDFAGLISKVIWCVIGLSPLLLSITGVYIWNQRRGKRKAARVKRRAKAAQLAGVTA